MTEPNWTPEPWFYEPGDDEAVVAAPAYPAMICAEPNDHTTLTIAEFPDVAYIEYDSQFWTEEEKIQRDYESDNDYSRSYGESVGYREYGSGSSNAERAADAVNFVAGYSKEELAKLHSLKSVMLLAQVQVEATGSLLLDVRDDSARQVQLLKTIHERLDGQVELFLLVDDYLREIGVVKEQT